MMSGKKSEISFLSRKISKNGTEFRRISLQSVDVIDVSWTMALLHSREKEIRNLFICKFFAVKTNLLTKENVKIDIIRRT